MKNIFVKENQTLISDLDKMYLQESSDLVNAVAHDIKNPLGIIDLSLGLLEDKIEQILVNTDEEQANKIRKFLSNINHSIERCQVILDNTIAIRSLSSSNEVDTLELKTFFEEFYIYAKPNLKRSKISIENCLEEDFELQINKQACAKLIILFLKVTAEKTGSNASSVMNISFNDNKLLLKIYSRTNEAIDLKEDTNQSNFLKYQLDNLCQNLKTDYKIEKVENTIIATLNWPNFI